jgi:hypothetical protein
MFKGKTEKNERTAETAINTHLASPIVASLSIFFPSQTYFPTPISTTAVHQNLKSI